MVQLSYLDFDVLLERAESGYRSRLLNSPAGQATASFTLPLPDPQVESLLALLRGHNRDADPITVVQSAGQRLFLAAFSGDVGARLGAARNVAALSGVGLRLRLRLSDVPELATLPWEFVCDPSDQSFLALSGKTPVVRYMDMPTVPRPQTIRLPLRILVAIAKPSGFTQFDAARHREAIENAWAAATDSRSLDLDFVQPATLATVQARLSQANYHIFHFVGHGAFDDDAQDGLLVFETECGEGHYVSARAFGVLLRDQALLRLAVLCSCQAGQGSAASTFSGTAQRLVQAGIPAVIAMQFEVSDRAATKFAFQFYSSLAAGTVIDVALTEARKAIYLDENATEWGTPALFMQSPDGVIWRVQVSDHSEDGKGMAEGKRRKILWWERISPDVDGDIIVGQVGDNATGVVIGKDVTQIINLQAGGPQTDARQVIEDRLAALEARAVEIKPRLDPIAAGMVDFQLELLRGELTKRGPRDVPSANAIMRVSDWLLDNVPDLARTLRDSH